MAQKRHEIHPAQGSLLEQVSAEHVAVAETYPNDPAEKLLGHQDEPRVVYGPPGSYVNIADRAQHLDEALSKLANRNMLLGFDVASNSRQYKRPIWGRYADRTPRVQSGAATKRERLLQEAKQEFWQASGYAALRGTGLVPEPELRSSAAMMWRRFSTKYGDPEKVKARDQYRRTLKRAGRTATRTIERSAA